MSNETKQSVVAERFGFLVGKTVNVRARGVVDGQLAEERLDGVVFSDLLPAGRIYFFVFVSGGTRVMFQTEHVIKIEEVRQ